MYAYNLILELNNEICEGMELSYLLTANDLSEAKMKFKEYLNLNEKALNNLINRTVNDILDIDYLRKKIIHTDETTNKIFEKYYSIACNMIREEIYNSIEKICPVESTIVGSMIIESDQGGGSCHHIIRENQIKNRKENIHQIMNPRRNKISIEPYNKMKKEMKSCLSKYLNK